MVDAQTVSNAFNQQNDKKSWRVTCTGELVHFSTGNGMVAIVYHADTGRFQVKFNKFQAAFGDYMKAIARSLYVILNTLKSAGLPFEAPPSMEGIAVIAELDGADVYARWEPMAVLSNVLSVPVGDGLTLNIDMGELPADLL